MILFDADAGLWHLQEAGFSYVLGLSPVGSLRLLHAGKAVSPSDFPALEQAWKAATREQFLEMHDWDYAAFGNNDLRAPALLLEHPDGSRLSEFRYVSHEIKGLALSIHLNDTLVGQALDLHFELKGGVLLRRAKLSQLKGSSRIRRLCSLSLDLPPGQYEALSLKGDWAKERQEQRTPIPQGLLKFESRRGISSHQLSPFVGVTKGAEAWGVTLIYSGNWMIECEGHCRGGIRINAGLNDFDFSWNLKEGESFETPTAVFAYSEEGLGGLSHKLHRYVRDHLIPPRFKGRPAPVLLNSWEACYFNFDHTKVIELAKGAKELGAEMLVLDDGWFGKRDSDNSSLGDWYDDTRKLPKGIKGLAEEVRSLGLKFGLWFEPEMISPESELIKKHPDWAILPKGRKATLARTQLLIDMSRPEVVDYLFERLSFYIREAALDYVKWDMNRPMWETPDPTLPHRFMLGTYDLMRRIQSTFPDLLIEGCAGGGARFDYDILRYHPQIWASDNTDALDRVRIQWGASYFVPLSSMGSHISEVPNHITKRSTPLKLRAHVAMSANLGLELDPSRVPEAERQELKGYLDEYRKVRHLVLEGDFHRLEHPDTGRAAWAFTSPKGNEALVFVFQLEDGPEKPVAFERYALQIKTGLSGKKFESAMLRVRIPDG